MKISDQPPALQYLLGPPHDHWGSLEGFSVQWVPLQYPVGIPLDHWNLFRGECGRHIGWPDKCHGTGLCGIRLCCIWFLIHLALLHLALVICGIWHCCKLLSFTFFWISRFAAYVISANLNDSTDAGINAEATEKGPHNLRIWESHIWITHWDFDFRYGFAILKGLFYLMFRYF